MKKFELLDKYLSKQSQSFPCQYKSYGHIFSRVAENHNFEGGESGEGRVGITFYRNYNSPFRMHENEIGISCFMRKDGRFFTPSSITCELLNITFKGTKE